MTSGSAARVVPLAIEALTAELEPILRPLYEASDTKGILMTLAKAPDLLRAWLPLASHVFKGSSLESADAELVTLRVCWQTHADYEFTHHAAIAPGRGVSVEQIEAVAENPASPVFNARQRLVLTTVEELLSRGTLSDQSWAALRKTFTEVQCMDLVATCGNYQLIAMMQRVLGVELEANMSLHPACQRRRDKS